MSMWTYVIGAIEVDCVGRTDTETEYILNTILSNMPLITGSEGGATTSISKSRWSESSFCDEFGREKTKQIDYKKSYIDRHYRKKHHRYLITIYGALRDREFEQTLKETTKFLFRLSKHTMFNNISLTINAYGKKYTFDMSNMDVFVENYKHDDLMCYDSMMWQLDKDISRPVGWNKTYKDFFEER